MLKQITFCTVLVALLTPSSSVAQAFEQSMEVQVSRNTDWTPNQAVGDLRMSDVLALRRSDWRSGALTPSKEVLRAIARWLSENSDLPVILEVPRVELAPATKIARMRRTGAAANGRQEDPVGDSPIPAAHSREVIAIYDDATRTILLAEGWTGTTTTELSILVHELVHHIQNLGNLQYECPAARERIAYEAQERWLGLFGKNLKKAFELDAFTLLVSTTCLY